MSTITLSSSAAILAAVQQHPIVRRNRFCEWFRTGAISREDVRRFAVQFSVFSNGFLVAQLKKMIQAPTLAAQRAAKEILANEIGVVFRSNTRAASPEPELVSTEGSVDGGTFRFRAAHFEWLLTFAEPLGLAFADLGRPAHGTRATLHFLAELERLFGSADLNVSAGASFAIENWAAAGFWKDLIAGLSAFKRRECPALNLAFFTWHDRIEDQHAAHTHDELGGHMASDGFDAGAFQQAGREALDAVAVFWDGMLAEATTRAARESITAVDLLVG